MGQSEQKKEGEQGQHPLYRSCSRSTMPPCSLQHKKQTGCNSSSEALCNLWSNDLDNTRKDNSLILGECAMPHLVIAFHTVAFHTGAGDRRGHSAGELAYLLDRTKAQPQAVSQRESCHHHTSPHSRLLDRDRRTVIMGTSAKFGFRTNAFFEKRQWSSESHADMPLCPANPTFEFCCPFLRACCQTVVFLTVK